MEVEELETAGAASEYGGTRAGDPAPAPVAELRVAVPLTPRDDAAASTPARTPNRARLGEPSPRLTSVVSPSKVEATGLLLRPPATLHAQHTCRRYAFLMFLGLVLSGLAAVDMALGVLPWRDTRDRQERLGQNAANARSVLVFCIIVFVLLVLGSLLLFVPLFLMLRERTEWYLCTPAPAPAYPRSPRSRQCCPRLRCRLWQLPCCVVLLVLLFFPLLFVFFVALYIVVVGLKALEHAIVVPCCSCLATSVTTCCDVCQQEAPKAVELDA